MGGRRVPGGGPWWQLVWLQDEAMASGRKRAGGSWLRVTAAASGGGQRCLAAM